MIHSITKPFLLTALSFLAFSGTQAQTVVQEDDMEAYTLDYVAPQSADWTTWTGAEGGAFDAFVSDEQAASGSNSVKLVGGGMEDLVYLLGDRTSGSYTLEFKMYIPSGNQGYYNIQHFETPGTEWAHEVYFNTGGIGSLNAGITGVASFTWPADTWFDIVQEINIDLDQTSLSIDGTTVHSWTFSDEANATGGTNQLGGINLYPADASYVYYIDDIKLTENVVVVPSVEMTLTVDMSEQTVDPNGVHVAGEFQGWDPAATPMTDNGDGTYSVTLTVDGNADYEYKFINGNDWPGEESVPMDCGVDNGFGGYNREISLGASDVDEAEVCFAACEDCAVVSAIDEISMDGIRAWPNPASESIRVDLESPVQGAVVRVMDLTGKVVLQSQVSGNGFSLDISSLPQGVYTLTVEEDMTRVVRMSVVR